MMLFAGFHRLFTVLGALAVLNTTVASAATPAGKTIDGIRCDTAEGVAFHIHAHVSILDRGKSVPIPSDVGRPLIGQCLYWLHTHTPDGIVHIESPVIRDFTLGNFFDVWGEPLSRTHVASVARPSGTIHVWVNGRPYAGDPRAISLLTHTEIVIEGGPPYSKPVAFTGWGNL